MIMMMIINVIYIAQFDTNGILTALWIVIMYVQTHYMHVCVDIHEQLYPYTFIGLHIHTYTDTCTNICVYVYIGGKKHKQALYPLCQNFRSCDLPQGAKKLTRHFVTYVIVEKSASFSVVM